jgi:hypothetical protein
MKLAQISNVELPRSGKALADGEEDCGEYGIF